MHATGVTAAVILAFALATHVSAQGTDTRPVPLPPAAAPGRPALAARPAPVSPETVRTLPPLGPQGMAGSAASRAVRRGQAIEHGDFYYARLTAHRIGSFAMLPLFAGEYLLGHRLLEGGDAPGWVGSAHGVVAGGIGLIFGLNTVTGVWNLWEGRKEPEGRARRFLHSALMLAADAGFLYTASLAEDDDEFENEGGGGSGAGDGSIRHRNAALASISLSTAGTLLMWLWKD